MSTTDLNRMFGNPRFRITLLGTNDLGDKIFSEGINIPEDISLAELVRCYFKTYKKATSIHVMDHKTKSDFLYNVYDFPCARMPIRARFSFFSWLSRLFGGERKVILTSGAEK